MSKPINGVEPSQWVKHLRPWGKRVFWKRHRGSELEPDQIMPGKVHTVDKKRYGLLIKHVGYPSLRLASFSWKRWYKNKRAREMAAGKCLKDGHTVQFIER